MTAIIIIVVVALVFFVTICVVTFMVWKRETEMRTDSIRAIEHKLEKLGDSLSSDSGESESEAVPLKTENVRWEVSEFDGPRRREGILRKRDIDPFSWMRNEDQQPSRIDHETYTESELENCWVQTPVTNFEPVSDMPRSRDQGSYPNTAPHARPNDVFDAEPDTDPNTDPDSATAQHSNTDLVSAADRDTITDTAPDRTEMQTMDQDTVFRITSDPSQIQNPTLPQNRAPDQTREEMFGSNTGAHTEENFDPPISQAAAMNEPDDFLEPDRPEKTQENIKDNKTSSGHASRYHMPLNGMPLDGNISSDEKHMNQEELNHKDAVKDDDAKEQDMLYDEIDLDFAELQRLISSIKDSENNDMQLSQTFSGTDSSEPFREVRKTPLTYDVGKSGRKYTAEELETLIKE